MLFGAPIGRPPMSQYFSSCGKRLLRTSIEIALLFQLVHHGVRYAVPEDSLKNTMTPALLSRIISKVEHSATNTNIFSRRTFLASLSAGYGLVQPHKVCHPARLSYIQDLRRVIVVQYLTRMPCKLVYMHDIHHDLQTLWAQDSVLRF